MIPRKSDPNNHVPEVTPDDDWGDLEGFDDDPSGESPTALPPRRAFVERSAPIPADAGGPGLRIDSNLSREESLETPIRLEVQELGVAVVRLERSASAPPKVPRQITFQERPAPDPTLKTEGESHHWGHAKRHPTLWILGAGVLVLAIVVLVMMLLPSINAPNASRGLSHEETFNVVIEEKIEGIEAMNLLLTKQPEAMRIFSSYATATQADEIIPLLRNGLALKETLRRNWRPREIPRRWEPAPDSSWSILELAGHPCGLLQGTFPDHSKFAVYFTNDNDLLLLDWKATAAFGTATFQQLEKSQGDPGEIRGEISAAEFYSATYPEADYQSYRLVSPDGEIAIWCYARRMDLANALIAPLFNKGEIVGEAETSRKITLRLERGPPGSLPNQWLIAETLHIDWVSP